ncbi:MAG: acetylxylan esterase [Planctomycetia bacterium]|nr:acetylxylan esterase [Planctomycetia bacterium]
MLHRIASIDFVRAVMLATVFSLGLVHAVRAAVPRALPEGQLPNDKRLGPLKDLNGYFPFTPSATKEEWAKRAEQVRRRILVANGLWPMPEKTPANAVVHGKVDRDGYTVERVYLESYPGHFVTGSLYRPTGKTGKLPAVLCPHGHWPNGRFTDAGLDKTRLAISEGQERFEVGGRSPLQARCVQLARMGCVVFHYDMIGYADSVQIPFELAHGFAKQRPDFDTPSDWGFFSTQAELRQQSIMGLQTYNSIRALDWLSELPDVDPARIGVTGASGGGTQTFVLCAIDPRPAVAFPAVMVSTAMQGGCTCENCSNLRIGTGNIEFAAMMAPRPLGMSGALDWTKDLATKGFPELKQHYAMLGAPELVMAKVMPQFGHNYNYVSREVMYHWFNKHLKLGLSEPILEEDYNPLSIAEMTVWDASHPKPASGGDYERSLLKIMTEDSDRQISALLPNDSTSLAKFREIVGGGVDVLIGRGLSPATALEYKPITELDKGQYVESASLLRNKPEEEEIPVIVLHPKKWNKRVVIWVDEAGKAGLYGSDGAPSQAVQKLLASGAAVVGLDLLYQGEFLADGKPLTLPRRVDNKREFAGYTLGYNPSLFAQRVHDILSLVSFCRTYADDTPEISLVAFGPAGAWAAAARAQAGGVVARAAIDTGGFRFAKLSSISDLNFLAGGAKYGDLPGMLALGAPGDLWLAGEGTVAPAIVSAAYSATDSIDKLTRVDRATIAAAIQWLTSP